MYTLFAQALVIALVSCEFSSTQTNGIEVAVVLISTSEGCLPSTSIKLGLLQSSVLPALFVEMFNPI